MTGMLSTGVVLAVFNDACGWVGTCNDRNNSGLLVSKEEADDNL
jgi:hypothetical protein